MKVDVILITYNQENYIRQALESILMQQTTSDVEIIVADDCSTDKTLDIIKEYIDKTPFKFRFLPQTKNLGYIRNYQQAFAACTSEYVAIMEGDDYWISPLHLQYHIDFLENHPEYSMSFNRHIRYFVDEERQETLNWEENTEYKTITTEQLAMYDNPIGNFSCCFYRGDVVRELDPRLFDLYIADWMIGIYFSQFSPIAYLKDVTSVYRIHQNGQWSRMSEKEQKEQIINVIKTYDRFFDYKYTKAFTKHTERLKKDIYGDKSLRGFIKRSTPNIIRKIYRQIVR